jgi:hypothetical protein
MQNTEQLTSNCTFTTSPSAKATVGANAAPKNGRDATAGSTPARKSLRCGALLLIDSLVAATFVHELRCKIEAGAETKECTVDRRRDRTTALAASIMSKITQLARHI